MKNYKIDFAANTMTITKDFAIAASDPTTPEFEILAKFKAAYPGMKIVHKTCRPSKSKKARADKGLTYERMERYIRLHENSDELIENFEMVKALAAQQKNSYLFTKNWFMQQFPDYGELPTINHGKIYVLPIAVPEVEEKPAEEEVASNAIPLGKVENF